MKYRMDVSMCQGNLGHKMWVCMDVKKKVPSLEPFLYLGGAGSLLRTSLCTQIRYSTKNLVKTRNKRDFCEGWIFRSLKRLHLICTCC